MKNTPPLNNPRLEQARQELLAIYAKYDVAGAFTVINPEERGFAYPITATWSAITADAQTPEGFHIRTIAAVHGQEGARQKIAGAAWTCGALMDFGMQTHKWSEELLNSLRAQGLASERTPFGGATLGTVTVVEQPREAP